MPSGSNEQTNKAMKKQITIEAARCLVSAFIDFYAVEFDKNGERWEQPVLRNQDLSGAQYIYMAGHSNDLIEIIR